MSSVSCLPQALPAFGAEHFGMAADLARGGGSGSAQQGLSLEVCRAAEAARLQRLTQQAPLDYAAAAAVRPCRFRCCCCCRRRRCCCCALRDMDCGPGLSTADT